MSEGQGNGGTSLSFGGGDSKLSVGGGDSSSNPSRSRREMLKQYYQQQQKEKDSSKMSSPNSSSLDSNLKRVDPLDIGKRTNNIVSYRTELYLSVLYVIAHQIPCQIT